MKIIVEIDEKTKAQRTLKPTTVKMLTEDILPDIAKRNPQLKNNAELTVEIVTELLKNYIHQEMRRFL